MVKIPGKWITRSSVLVRDDRVDYHIPEALYLQGVTDTHIWLPACFAEDIAHRAAGCPLTRCFDLDVHHVHWLVKASPETMCQPDASFAPAFPGIA
jgi:hypothetical protein